MNSIFRLFIISIILTKPMETNYMDQMDTM